MLRFRSPIALAAACVLLAGCPAAPPPTAAVSTKPTAAVSTKPTAVKPNTTPNLASKTAVSGSAIAPSGMVAAGGGNILSHNGGVMVAAGGGNLVAAGGGNLVAAGGGNVVPTGSGRYRHQATAQKPLAGTTVYLTDGQGQLVDGVAPVETDAQGRYKLEGVPKEGTYLVHVRANSASGEQTTLVTLVQPADGKPADVSTETTCVAVSLMGEGGSKKLSGMSLAAFQTAVAVMGPLVANGVAPDLADRAAIMTWMTKLLGEVAVLKVAIDGMNAQMNAIAG